MPRRSAAEIRQAIETKLAHLPTRPGVYLFRDRQGEVVYVGKAKSLRSRVRSYFQEGTSDTRYFIPVLNRVLGDIETRVTETEKEAAILENNLIKEHRPRFNVKLRDDKNFLSLKLDRREAWPRLHLVRQIRSDGARYFGPYHSATAARRTATLVNKHFQLRTCSNTDFAARKRPCLQYQIKRCPAPCVLPVERAYYAEQVESVELFLSGRHDELSALLSERMRLAAQSLEFEVAAVHRDQLRAIEKVRESQRVVSTDLRSRDVLGFHREGDLMELAVLQVREGKLSDISTKSIRELVTSDGDAIAAYLMFAYADPDKRDVVPDELLLPCEIEAADGVGEVLAEQLGKRVRLSVPRRGHGVDLIKLANDNAKHAFEEKRRVREDVDLRLQGLQQKLRLPHLPLRIECCDISHLGGEDSVGAVVSMSRGELDKSGYRTFHVRAPHHQGGDDYGAMYEVLARRFRRALAAQRAESRDAESRDTQSRDAQSRDMGADGEEETAWQAPDLFVVDGGRGQLGVALAAARDLGLHDLPIVAIAKEKENVQGETLVDRIYLPGQKNPVPVRSAAALFLIARLRDEAHRFSNHAREKLGRAKRFSSALDDVPGVGPKTKKELLRAFGSATQVRDAADEALLAVSGVSRRVLRALRESLGAPQAPHVDRQLQGEGDNQVANNDPPEGDNSSDDEG
jgi:excinuclease ABC subunit C